MGNFVLYMSVRDHISYIIPERWAIVVGRPDSILVVSVALTLQEIVNVSGPFVIRTLTRCLMPVIPVLTTYEVSVDITVTISFFQLVPTVIMILPVIIIFITVGIIVTIAVDRVIRIVVSSI